MAVAKQKNAVDWNEAQCFTFLFKRLTDRSSLTNKVSAPTGPLTQGLADSQSSATLPIWFFSNQKRSHVSRAGNELAKKTLGEGYPGHPCPLRGLPSVAGIEPAIPNRLVLKRWSTLRVCCAKAGGLSKRSPILQAVPPGVCAESERLSTAYSLGKIVWRRKKGELFRLGSLSSPGRSRTCTGAWVRAQENVLIQIVFCGSNRRSPPKHGCGAIPAGR